MKKTAISLALILALLAFATAANAAVLSPGLEILSAQVEMTLSAKKGETVVFSEAQFANAAGLSSCKSIEISSLPEKESGQLFFGDVPCVVGQVIEAGSISKLTFVPEKDAQSAGFGFTFEDSYAMTCNIVFAEKENTAPTALEAPQLFTFTGSAVSGEMRACDGEGDELFFEVLSYPEKGELLYDSKTGEFTYTAGSRVASDSFTFRVKDSAGNLSNKCVYTVAVKENDTGKSFCDMENSTSCGAAAVMADEGYMTYVRDGDNMYFAPDEQVTRLDFLVCAMNVFGAENIPTVQSTGFADDSSVPERYKGYVYSAAVLGIIGEPEQDGVSCFRPNDPITRAEASVILNNIIGYEAKTVSCFGGVPQWADGAIAAMYELGIYELDNGEWAAGKSLTKEESAAMLYRVYSLLGE